MHDGDLAAIREKLEVASDRLSGDAERAGESRDSDRSGFREHHADAIMTGNG
jgi:hypothetical protein